MWFWVILLLFQSHRNEIAEMAEMAEMAEKAINTTNKFLTQTYENDTFACETHTRECRFLNRFLLGYAHFFKTHASVRFLHKECDFHTLECDFYTLECDFHTHECHFDTL
jgi:hypothetical protein